MSIKQLKEEAIYQNNPYRLFEIMVEIKEELSTAYLDLAKCEDFMQKASLKGQVAVLNTLFTIVEKRIDEVKANEHDKERREMMMNRQFRQAAEAVLQKETFERIKELSLLNYKKFKDSRESLRMSKME